MSLHVVPLVVMRAYVTTMMVPYIAKSISECPNVEHLSCVGFISIECLWKHKVRQIYHRHHRQRRPHRRDRRRHLNRHHHINDDDDDNHNHYPDHDHDHDHNHMITTNIITIIMTNTVNITTTPIIIIMSICDRHVNIDMSQLLQEGSCLISRRFCKYAAYIIPFPHIDVFSRVLYRRAITQCTSWEAFGNFYVRGCGGRVVVRRIFGQMDRGLKPHAAVSNVGQFRSPHFACVFRKRH